MQKQFAPIKTIKPNRLSMFNAYEKRYCSFCAIYPKTGYCKFLKHRVKRPDESSCSWFIRKQEDL